jgi:hypothetical protein
MRYTLMCCCLILALPATASEIYRWVDDQGVVHYTDRPDRQGVERLTVRVSKPSEATPRVSAQPRAQGELMADDADAEQEALAAAVREANCQSASQRLQSLQAAPRLYREGAGGAREYLDNAEIERVLAEAAELVEAWCD